jgi:hypothetical protein
MPIRFYFAAVLTPFKPMKRTFTHARATLFLIVTLTLTAFTAWTQSYTFSASSGAFTPNSSGVAIDVIEDDEEISSAITLPFTFNYFGTNYTEFKACSNGFITFSTTTSSFSINGIESNTDLFIAPLWDDLDGFGGAASYQVTGSAPNRVLTIEWLNYKWGWTASTAGISFQVKLYETSNVIEFVYRQEVGSLASPSASIGLTSNSTTRFYSLRNSSSTATLHPTGFNSVNQKPATGQVYTFTPSSATVSAPTTQASSIQVTANTTGDNLNLSWTNGNGSYRAVFMKQTSSTSELPTLSNGTTYQAFSEFGSSLVSNGWYCVYNDNGNSVNVTDLRSDFAYRIVVIEYNGVGGNQAYNLSTATGNPLNVTTALVAPGTPLATLIMKRVSHNQATFNFQAGDGNKQAIFMRQGAPANAPAVDNTTYTANAAFGSGSQIGTTGWFCVYNGTPGFDVQITNLSANTEYTIHIVEYNGSAGSERYNVANDANNRVSVTTLPNIPVMTYTLASSAGTFTPLTGATAIDAIETDDALSNSINIGFTFRFSGVAYTSLRASSNGFISFNSFANNIGSQTLNSLMDSESRALIAPLWDDLGGSGGTASYTTTGTAPNRVFTIEYLNWRWSYFAGSAGISFQVKLYETTNKIEFIYRQEAGALSSPSASIGLAFPNKGTGNFISLNGSSAAPTASTTTETANISAKPASGQVYAFTPVKMNQAITFNTLTDKFFGDANFNLTATSSSGLPVSYTSSNTSIATISGNTVSIVGIGSVTITASQAGDQNYNAAADVQRSFIVNKGNQTITFPQPSARSYGSGSFELSASTTSNLPLTYTSSNPAVATVSGATVTITGVGSTDITASQAGNSNYNAASEVVRTLVINKADQIITFNNIGQKKYADEPFTLSASSNKGLPITFTSSNTAVATVSGATVTITGVGSTNITASQAGNSNYNAASQVMHTLVVNKGDQTITFDNIEQKKYLDEPFALSASSNKGLPITFVSLDLDVATIDGNMVTIVGAGSATITALQAGNDFYSAARMTAEGDAPYTLVASSSSGLPVTFSISSGNDPELATIEGNKLTPLRAGTITVQAQQVGNNNYFVREASQSFCILPAKPQIKALALDTESPTLEGPDQSHYFYEWYKDGTLFSTTTDHTLMINQPGSYHLVVGAEQCLSDASNAVSIIITDNEELLEKSVALYPNPVSELLKIDVRSLKFSGPVSVSIVDPLGREMENATGSEKFEFNVKAYNAGMYVVKIQGGTKQIVKSFIKK